MKAEKPVISAFTLDSVASLTGLSPGQLKYWDRRGFFVPSMAQENRRLPNSRVYTFKDVLALQVLKTLRMDLGVSLQHLRVVKDRLSLLSDNDWSERKLFVLNRRVVFDDDDGARREVVSGQYVLDIPLSVVRRKMVDAVQQLAKRTQAQIGYSEHNRGVMQNREVFSGTRIPVDAVRAFVEERFSDEEILNQYPSLTRADIKMVRDAVSRAA